MVDQSLKKLEFKGATPNSNLIFRLDREFHYTRLKSAISPEASNQEIVEFQQADLWQPLAGKVFQTGEAWQTDLEVSTTNEQRCYHVHLVPFAIDDSVEFVLGIVGDVTQSQQTKSALRESESRFQAMFDLGIGLAIVDSAGIFKQTNPTFQAILGYSSEALENQLISDFIHPDEREQHINLFQELLTGKQRTFNFKQRYIGKNSNIVEVTIEVSAIYNQTGLLESAIVMMQKSAQQTKLEQDITAQELDKQTIINHNQESSLDLIMDLKQQQFKEVPYKSEQLYRLLIENSSDGVITIELNGLISYVNQKFLSMTGYSSSQMIGYCWLEFIDEAKREVIKDQLQRPNNASSKYQLSIITKTGTRLLTIVSITPILGTNGNFEGSFGIITNITPFKAIQLELQQAREQLRAVLDAVPGLISWISSEGRYLGVNQQLADLFNLLPDAFVEKEVGFLNYRCEFSQFIEQFMVSGCQTKHRIIDLKISGKDRKYLIAAQKYNQDNAVISVGIDVTEGKLAQVQLQQKEAQLRLALEAACMGFWEWNLQTGLVTLSKSHEQLFGITLEAYDGTNESFLKIIHPEDRERVTLGDRQAIATGKRCDVEYRVILPDGSIRWIESKGQAYYDETGKPFRLTGVNLDITARKQAQLALDAHHQFLQTVIDTNPNLIFVKDAEGRYVMINQAFADFYDIDIEQLIGKKDTCFNFNDLEVQKFVLQDQEVLVTTEQKFIPEETCLNKSGKLHWFQTIKKPLFDAEGQAYQVLGVSTDITEHKQVEEQLRRSEAQLRLALDAARMGHWERKIQTGEINFSNNLEKLYGIEPNTYDGTYETYLAKLHPEDRDRVDQLTQHSINAGAYRDLEFRVVWPDGSIHWIESKGRVIYDEAGMPALLSGISLDISDRKFAEAQLNRSQEQLHLALEAARMVFWEWDIQTAKNTWSSNLEQIYGITANSNDGTYESFLQLVHPEDRCHIEQAVQECLATGNDYHVEFRLLSVDGSVRWIEGKGKVFFDEMGKPLRMIGIDLDISKRKEAETEIKESLREKEILLQEIHHRVKNNLQVISSLLDLQSQRFTDQVTLEIFQESQNRIKLMALVHETLYKYKDFVRINFSEFVKTLTDYLFRAYKKEESNITLQLNLDEVHLKLDKAIPCGLIISELISNSLKYAFPNQSQGIIQLTLSYEQQNYLKLTVKDNGVGLPANWESVRGKSLGLQLVNVLTNQLEGILELNQQVGTEFRISFFELDD